jgi:hypothetical protein
MHLLYCAGRLTNSPGVFFQGDFAFATVRHHESIQSAMKDVQVELGMTVMPVSRQRPTRSVRIPHNASMITSFDSTGPAPSILSPGTVPANHAIFTALSYHRCDWNSFSQPLEQNVCY